MKVWIIYEDGLSCDSLGISSLEIFSSKDKSEKYIKLIEQPYGDNYEIHEIEVK